MRKLGIVFMFAFIFSCNLFGPSESDLPVPVVHLQAFGYEKGDTFVITHHRQVFGIDNGTEQKIHGIAAGPQVPKSLDDFDIWPCNKWHISSTNHPKPSCYYTWYVSPCRKDDEFIPHNWRPMSFFVSGNDTIFSKPGELKSGWSTYCSIEDKLKEK